MLYSASVSNYKKNKRDVSGLYLVFSRTKFGAKYLLNKAISSKNVLLDNERSPTNYLDLKKYGQVFRIMVFSTNDHGGELFDIVLKPANSKSEQESRDSYIKNNLIGIIFRNRFIPITKDSKAYYSILKLTKENS